MCFYLCFRFINPCLSEFRTWENVRLVLTTQWEVHGLRAWISLANISSKPFAQPSQGTGLKIVLRHGTCIEIYLKTVYRTKLFKTDYRTCYLDVF